MKPETKLMGAIFGECSRGLNDEDYRESVEGISLREALETLLDKVAESRSHNAPQFSQRIKPLMMARFGFNGPPKTYEQLGEMFKRTRERMRQNELTALSMLRHPLRSEWLKPYLR